MNSHTNSKSKINRQGDENQYVPIAGRSSQKNYTIYVIQKKLAKYNSFSPIHNFRASNEFSSKLFSTSTSTYSETIQISQESITSTLVLNSQRCSLEFKPYDDSIGQISHENRYAVVKKYYPA